MTQPRTPAPNPASARLRLPAVIARWLGAIAALALTLYAGRHNHSILLPILFAGWVLLPYIGLVAVDRLAARSRLDIANAIHAAALLLALIPPILYSATSTLAPGRPATFSFLSVPAATWLAIVTLLIAGRLQSK